MDQLPGPGITNKNNATEERLTALLIIRRTNSLTQDLEKMRLCLAGRKLFAKQLTKYIDNLRRGQFFFDTLPGRLQQEIHQEEQLNKIRHWENDPARCIYTCADSGIAFVSWW